MQDFNKKLQLWCLKKIYQQHLKVVDMDMNYLNNFEISMERERDCTLNSM